MQIVKLEKKIVGYKKKNYFIIRKENIEMQ